MSSVQVSLLYQWPDVSTSWKMDAGPPGHAVILYNLDHNKRFSVAHTDPRVALGRES